VPRTPQRFPGQAIEEDSLRFLNRTEDSTDVGSLWMLGNDIYARDQFGKFNIRQPANTFEVPFTNKLSVVVAHNRGTRPLVQVVTPISLGWNADGWSLLSWNSGTTVYKRKPDNEYETRHISVNRFIVQFSALTTGRVLYF
jgi:hypothetical protein